METIILRPKNKRESRIFMEMAKALNTPFETKDEGKVPNKETIKAMEELKKGKGIRFDSVSSLFTSI